MSWPDGPPRSAGARRSRSRRRTRARGELSQRLLSRLSADLRTGLRWTAQLGRMPITTADRRSAHRRVGAAAIAAFLVLLLLALMHRPAQAEPTAPVATPAATPSIQPTQPGPSQSLPADPDPDDPGFGHDRRFGPRGGDEGRGGFGGGGGGAPSVPSDPGGGGAAPAPSTGGSQT